MNFKKVLSFFLTGATALSMTTAAFASEDTVIMLPADVASQDWYAPAVRYVMEYDLMDVGHPENGASVFYLPVYIYFPVPWATYRPEIWAAYEAKDRDSLKVEYEKVMYDYMDDWLTNGNNSENRGTSWGQYKSRLEKGMGIDIGLTARETGFYETNYFYGGATATEQRASSTLSDTATSFIIEYIMGQKTEADWESFKQSWNDMGGADWTKEVNEQYFSIVGK